jgi:hypothetical protein
MQQKTEIKHVRELIHECLREIEAAPSTRLIDARYIIEDMGISEWYFRSIQNRMPFLFRITKNGPWKARLCDYEIWKENLAKNNTTP